MPTRRILGPEEEQELRELLDDGALVSVMSQKFGVSESTVNLYLPIWRRASWTTRPIDLTGRTFDDWTALYRAERGRSYWMCRCVCGAIRPVQCSKLLKGLSRRCKTCANRIKNQNRKAAEAEKEKRS